MIVGSMLLFTVQALGELAVLYPVNGAFYQYAVRFLDPAWYACPKFAMKFGPFERDWSDNRCHVGDLRWAGIMHFRGL